MLPVVTLSTVVLMGLDDAISAHGNRSDNGHNSKATQCYIGVTRQPCMVLCHL